MWLIRFLLWLFGRAPLSGVSILTVKADDMNVRLNWKNSTPGARQAPLAATLIEARTDISLPWGTVNNVPAGTTTLLITSPAPGDWQYRATEVDTKGGKSQPTQAVNVAVPFDPPTGANTLTAAIE